MDLVLLILRLWFDRAGPVIYIGKWVIHVWTWIRASYYKIKIAPITLHQCQALLELVVNCNLWEIEGGQLTPSTVKFPIRVHLSMTMFVSGNIAWSHAPSLFNSSAKPCLSQWDCLSSVFYMKIVEVIERKTSEAKPSKLIMCSQEKNHLTNTCPGNKLKSSHVKFCFMFSKFPWALIVRYAWTHHCSVSFPSFGALMYSLLHWQGQKEIF